MGKKMVFPRIEVGQQAFSDQAIVEHQRVLKQREARAAKRFESNVRRFRDVPFLPSFLLRTLNDSLYVAPKDLSTLQKTLIGAWIRSGLGKRHTIEQLQKFHETSPETVRLLDRRYFELATKDIDRLFLESVRKTDWTPYLDSKPIAASRFRKALKSGTTNVLNASEKLFLTTACDLKPNQGIAALKEFQRRGLGQYIGIAPEQPSPDAPNFYNFSGRITRWRLLTSSDHIGGNADPVFIIQTFYNSSGWLDSPGGIQSAGTRILRPGDDVAASQNWTNYDDWAALLEQAATIPIVGSAFADLLVPADIVDDTPTVCKGANPTVVVNAFEDDDWISEETENYIDFATDVAARVALLAGGLTSTVFSVINLAWDLLCLLDSLDENDRFAPQAWVLPENQIAHQPVSEFPKTFDLSEVDGSNHWQIEVKLTITDPIF